MEIKQPIWHLMARCPACGQADCLAFMRCPQCGRIIIVCEDDEAIFPEPRDLTRTAHSARCPNCQADTAFMPATASELHAIGSAVGEYQ
jgi:hypothetical protein